MATITIPHPRYPSLGPGQPAQKVSPYGDGHCIDCSERVLYRAPQRPRCVDCWDQCRHLPMAVIRLIGTRYCHGCGRTWASTAADVYCHDCKSGE